MINTYDQVGIEKILLTLTNVITKADNVIFSSEKWMFFPLGSITRQGCLFSSLLYNIPFSSVLFKVLLRVLTRTARQEKAMEAVHIEKEELKLSIC
jgi:hypothetical protein